MKSYLPLYPLSNWPDMYSVKLGVGLVINKSNNNISALLHDILCI